MKITKRFKENIWFSTLLQSGLVLVCLWLSRLVFYYFNGGGESFSTPLWKLMWLGLPFDLCAWGYFNALFLIMRFLPAPWVGRRWWLRITDVLFFLTNIPLLIINLGDAAYFPFQGARLRWAAFKELVSDPDMYVVLLSYCGTYWWAFVVVGLVLALIVYGYRRIIPVGIPGVGLKPLGRWSLRGGVFLLVVAGIVLCMRGRLSTVGKPLKPVDAMFGISKVEDQNVVLNTPFNLIHTIKDIPFQVYDFFGAEELRGIRNSERRGDWGDRPMIRKNLLIIVIESGGQFWLDSFNNARNVAPRGLMPFTDSIARESKVIRYNFATGRRSNEGLNALLGGFPMFSPHNLMGSPYQNVKIDALPSLLAGKGYATKYYSGCNGRSFAMDQMAMMMGMQATVDRQVYNNDKDYDGVWGISDHAMGAYVANDLNRMPQPWFGMWFTLSSHAPFRIPKGWTGGKPYLSGEGTMERSMEYVDRSLRLFFETVRKEPWYKNTIFVITADHGCRDMRGTMYDNAWLQPSIPMIIFDPTREVVEPGIVADRVMSQIDTEATLLGILRYPDPYVSIGTDVLNLPEGVKNYALYRESEPYHIISNHYVVVWDGKSDRPQEIFDVRNDQEMRKPIPYRKGEEAAREADAMIRFAKGYLQDFSHRLVEGRLSH